MIATSGERHCAAAGCERDGQLRRGLCHACYERWRIRQKAYGRFESTYTDAAPIREHVQRLLAAGLTRRRIAELSGLNRKQVQVLLGGRTDRGTGPARIVSHRTATALLALSVPDIGWTLAADRHLVDATGTVRRLQALVAAGWTQGELGHRIGVAERNMSPLVHGRLRRVTAARARSVAGLFAELQLRPGPSGAARRRGAAHDWALPLEWDEESIDDPAAKPQRARWTRSSAVTERRERVVELTARGLTCVQIADLLAVTPAVVIADRIRGRRAAS